MLNNSRLLKKPGNRWRTPYRILDWTMKGWLLTGRIRNRSIPKSKKLTKSEGAAITIKNNWNHTEKATQQASSSHWTPRRRNPKGQKNAARTLPHASRNAWTEDSARWCGTASDSASVTMAGPTASVGTSTLVAGSVVHKTAITMISEWLLTQHRIISLFLCAGRR